MVFTILLGLNLAVALIVGFFFFTGLADGSVSAFNIKLWIMILTGLAVILGGGLALRATSRPVLANLVLSILAVPAILYAIFVAAVLVSGQSWN